MPPPSFPVDLSTPIRREAELESMNYQVPPAATQRFGAEAISTNERWQHGLHAGGMMRETIGCETDGLGAISYR